MIEPRLRMLPDDAPLAVDNFLLAAQLEHALANQGRPRAVYALDHPQNAKHGRQGELSRMQRDAQALEAARRAPGLLVVEPAALPLRQRAGWLWQLCRRYPEAGWLEEHWLDQGSKRYVVYSLASADAARTRCAAPALGYIDIIEGSRLAAGQRIGGWATAGGSGVDGLRLTLDAGQTLPLDWPLDLPALVSQLGDTGDPDFPQVGWQAQLPHTLAPGRHWLRLEAKVAGRGWHPLTAVQIRVVAR